ncbi:MAG: thioredoxin family protein [Planctomycetota bacterium]
MDRPSQLAPAPGASAPLASVRERIADIGLARSLSTGDVTVIAFVTRWCRACKVPTRCLAGLGLRPGAGAGLRCIDVAADPLAARRWRVAAVPTLVVCVHGREVARQVGLRGVAELRCFLARSLACALPAQS